MFAIAISDRIAVSYALFSMAEMSGQLGVSLNEVAEVAGRPLREKSLWALLKLAGQALQYGDKPAPPTFISPANITWTLAGGGLLTPESILLRPGGQVDVLPGVYDEAAELRPDSLLRRDEQKAQVHSLGASLLVVSDAAEESSLQRLLQAMVAKEPAGRPSLQEVLASCAHMMKEEAVTEVKQLAHLVFGDADHVSKFAFLVQYVRECFFWQALSDVSGEQDLDTEVRSE